MRKQEWDTIREIRTDVKELRKLQTQHSLTLARLENDRKWVLRIAGGISFVVSIFIGLVSLLFGR